MVNRTVQSQIVPLTIRCARYVIQRVFLVFSDLNILSLLFVFDVEIGDVEGGHLVLVWQRLY